MHYFLIGKVHTMPSVNDLKVVKQFLEVLSWTKIAQLSLFVLVVTLGVLIYSSQESIISFVTQSPNQKPVTSVLHESLSKKTIETIDSAVTKSDLIVGIIILSVDFQKNTRTVVYGKSDHDPLVIYVAKALNLSSTLPLFNSDPINNKRMTDVINGEFICNKYAETINAQIFPETMKYIDTVCISGIPPYYGTFSGIIGIYLKHKPSPEEIDQVRVISRNTSALIYDKDTN